MKELTDSLAQLVAVIIILIALAVSTAAFSQWASSGEAAVTDEESPATAEVARQ